MNLKYNRKNYKSNLVEFSEFIFQKYFFSFHNIIYIIFFMPLKRGWGDKNKIFILIKMSHSITQKNINSGVIN